MGVCLLAIPQKLFKKEGPSVFDSGVQADSIPIYRGQVMKEGLLIKVF
jgi:hypothetical protein